MRCAEKSRPWLKPLGDANRMSFSLSVYGITRWGRPGVGAVGGSEGAGCVRGLVSAWLRGPA